MGAVEQAIFLNAGRGTRRYPVAKTIEKNMSPIGNFPLIHFLVEDCLNAGVKNIIHVVSEDSDQIENYFTRDPELEKELEDKGDSEKLELLRSIGRGATFNYVRQPPKPYGTAVPVSLCADLIHAEQFLVMTGDDFVYNEDGSSEIARLIERTEAIGATSGMLVASIDPQETGRYGVIATSGPESALEFESIVERPSPEEAPSNRINISKYLFDRHMLECVLEVMRRPPTGPNDEYQITDALSLYRASGGKIAVVPIKGEYMDGGSLEGWFKAVTRIVPTQL